jgi:hypothetical protein
MSNFMIGFLCTFISCLVCIGALRAMGIIRFTVEDKDD